MGEVGFEVKRGVIAGSQGGIDRAGGGWLLTFAIALSVKDEFVCR
jgi:hypothetical protein